MMIHHEERYNSWPENLPNFTNPLAYNIEARNDTFTFKEATSQLDSLGIMDSMRKEIGDPEIYNHWNLVRIRELNVKIPSCPYVPSIYIGLYMGGSSNTNPAFAPM